MIEQPLAWTPLEWSPNDFAVSMVELEQAVLDGLVTHMSVPASLMQGGSSHGVMYAIQAEYTRDRLLHAWMRHYAIPARGSNRTPATKRTFW